MRCASDSTIHSSRKATLRSHDKDIIMESQRHHDIHQEIRWRISFQAPKISQVERESTNRVESTNKFPRRNSGDDRHKITRHTRRNKTINQVTPETQTRSFGNITTVNHRR